MSVFENVVCGIDGSPEGLEAARQAGRLARDRVVLVAVVDAWDLVLGEREDEGGARPPGAWEPRLRKRFCDDAESALAAAREAVGTGCAVETKLVEGSAFLVLQDEVVRREATLLALGTHGRSRAAGIVLGSVATAAVHHAPCSVLVTRARRASGRFPAAIVVGSDGSPASAIALSAARDVRDRYGSALRVIVGRGGGGRLLEPGLVEEQVAPEPLLVSDRPPVEALVEASDEADLVLVGSRGLLGLPSLGSVSERVAHQAACSVLVVRRPTARPQSRSGQVVLVGETMTSPVVTAPIDATVEDVARVMLDRELGAVPIVDAGGRVCGIVTESDFAGREVVLATLRYGTELRAPKVLGELVLGNTLEDAYEAAGRRRVDEIMTTPVLAAVENEPVQQALERMLHHQIGHLPVVRHGVPIGMLSSRDLLLLAARTWAAGGEEQSAPESR